jgi:hypothetical protein
MKRLCFPILLAVLAMTVATTAWTAATTCPATDKKAACGPLCPEGIQKKPATCPRATVDAKPSVCPAQKTTCTVKRSTCGSTSPKVMVKEKEGWKLVVHVLQPGSRSRGYHGELYKEGKRVEGEKEETLETSLGKLTWKGPMAERAHLWDSTGWVSEEKNLFEEETMPRPKDQTSLETLDRQVDDEIGKKSE